MTASESGERAPRNLRLFIAILLPDEIRAEIANAQSKLRSALPGGDISWTRPEQFHLTLRFLGNVPDTRLEALKSMVKAVGESSSPLELSAKGIGFFPPAGPPRVVWVGLQEESGRLGNLHDRIADATGDFGEPVKAQTFTGHVTLARVRRIKRSESETLRRVATTLAKNDFSRWRTGKMEIMRSDLTPDGARHESVLSVHLGDSA